MDDTSLSSPYSVDSTRWLYIGWPGDHPKSHTFMAGGLNPGRDYARKDVPKVEYVPVVDGVEYHPDERSPRRKSEIRWYRDRGYLPSPVSEWDAFTKARGGTQLTGVRITVRHFAIRLADVDGEGRDCTAVYTRVTLRNHAGSPRDIGLKVYVDCLPAGSTASGYEIPLGRDPDLDTRGFMFYDLGSIPSEGSVTVDFVTQATGMKLFDSNDLYFEAGRERLAAKGSFEENYCRMVAYCEDRLNGLARPVEIPVAGLADMYKSNVMTLWSSIVESTPHSHEENFGGLSSLELTDAEGGNRIRLDATRFDRCGPDPGGVTIGNRGGRECVYNLNTGDWIRCGTVDLSGKVKVEFIFQVPNAASLSPLIEVWRDGLDGSGTRIAVGTLPFTTSGGWSGDGWGAVSLSLIDTADGLHDIYVRYRIQEGFEMRGAASRPFVDPGVDCHYDRVFSHDAPTIVDYFMKAGDYAAAKALIESPSYKGLAGLASLHGYFDAPPKVILPYARYLLGTGDTAYFTPAVVGLIDTAARQTRMMREGAGHEGVIRPSSTFDDHDPPARKVVDGFAALTGLSAYRFIFAALGDAAKVAWADEQSDGLNSALNARLNAFMECAGPHVDWYCAYLDYDTGLRELSYLVNDGIYTGNFLGTTLSMSHFPWDAVSFGFGGSGTWSSHFDRALENNFDGLHESPNQGKCPDGSWNCWYLGRDHLLYGSVYNAGMGEQTLYSDRFRTYAIKSLEFLLHNQCAPFQWGEGIDKDLSRPEDDWLTPTSDFENWGIAMMNSTLLQSCITVNIDGSVVIGRGIPNHWLSDGAVIEWENVPVTKGERLGFTIRSGTDGGRGEITLALRWSSGPAGTADIVFDLPAFVGNVARVHVDGGRLAPENIDRPAGRIVLPRTTRLATVVLEGPAASPVIDLAHDGRGGLAFGGEPPDGILRYQTFTADSSRRISGVEVKIRRNTSDASGDVTAALHKVKYNERLGVYIPVGAPLSEASVTADEVGTDFGVVGIPLACDALAEGLRYAIVLGRAAPDRRSCEWCMSDGIVNAEKHGTWDGSSWIDDTARGTGWMRVHTAVSARAYGRLSLPQSEK
jgi:hypothetical protein